MNYRVVFVSGFDLPMFAASMSYIGGYFRTLEEARAAREVSGDLVVDRKGRVVLDQAWLWDWEKESPTCYSRRMIYKQALVE